MLDLSRLAAFREVAKRGSFSEAAFTLGFTQSAVSHQVGQLERQLGVSLLARGRRPVRPTPAGERLLVHAETIIGAANAAERELRGHAELETGALRIGAFLSACATFMPPAVGAFTARHPGVDVRLAQEEPPRALRDLIAGEIDIAVVFEEHRPRAEPDPRLEAVALRDDVYRIVLPPGHRLAGRSRLDFGDLEGERFVAPRAEGAGIGYREMIVQHCAEHDYEPDFAFTVSDVTVARAFVASGLAVGVMPDLTIGHPRPDVEVRSIEGIEPFRSIEARWMAGTRSAAIEPFVAALRSAL